MPTVAPTDATTLVSDDDTFAFALYQQLVGASAGGNLVYSPYSISLALSMAYAGAAGTTASQMATALDLSLPASTLFTAYDGLDLGIHAAATGTTGTNGQPFQLNIANALWADESLPLLSPFLGTLATDYGAGVQLADFVDSPDTALAAINTWVSNQTNAKIPSLLPPGAVDAYTRLALVDAVYFDGSWSAPFESSLTTPRPFTAASGTATTVDTMEMFATLRYAQSGGVQAVELPYQGGGESLVVLLPDSDHAAGFDASLDAESYASLVAALAPTLLDLQLPKFSVHGASTDLAQPLEALGMVAAFDPGSADFSAASTVPLYISHVFHQAYLSVDEQGTEAAAATGVVFEDAGAASDAGRPTPIPMFVDHPFAVAIRDVQSGTLLFLGKINTPGS